MSIPATEINSVGIFYKIKDSEGNLRGYLHGGVHVVYNDPDWEIDSRVMDAFDACADLLVENDIFKNDERLAALDLENIKKLKKNDEVIGTDLRLLLAAHKTGKTIESLEGLEEQKKFVAEWKEEMWLNLLRTPVEELLGIGKLKEIAHKITDEKIIEKLANHLCSKEFCAKFYHNRNVK